MVIVFGTICLDRLHRVDAMPQPGGYAEIRESVTAVGGEALNTAYCLARWQTDQFLAGNSLGRGAEADELNRLMREANIPEPHCPNHDHPVPLCDIYVAPNGERTMFGRGFNDLSTKSTVDGIPWANRTWFTADPNLGETSRKAQQVASAKGLRCYLMDFLGDEDRFTEQDVWQSSTDRVGKPGDVQTNLRWMHKWTAKHPCLSILSDGANGFVLGRPDAEPVHFPPFPAPVVIDSTGAGDCFRAGMLHSFCEGKSLCDSLLFAAAAASLKCRALGATTGVPTLDEVQQMISAHPMIQDIYRVAG